MKFYVGSTFTRYEEVRALVDRFTDMGHECTHDWTRGQWFSTDTSAGDGYQEMDHWLEMAQAEVDAIRSVADHRGFCLFLGEKASRGWSTENGLAIAFGVPYIAVVAPYKVSAFDSLKNVEVFSDVEAAVGSIVDFIHEAWIETAVWTAVWTGGYQGPGLYRHFKGGEYAVDGLGIIDGLPSDQVDDDVSVVHVVVYRSIKTNTIHVRPRDHFDTPVPDGSPRFKRIA